MREILNRLAQIAPEKWQKFPAEKQASLLKEFQQAFDAVGKL
jgi:hypothetical protein